MAQIFEPNFTINSRVFEIAAEGELANVLSHYNSEFLYNTLKTNIAQRTNQHSNVIQMPNFVAAIEQDFVYLKNVYKSENSDISQVRTETYKTIIDILCNEYQLVFKDNGDIDYCSAAFCLYDFLVSNFDSYLITFFTTFIAQEAQSIYDMMNLGAIKKNKDTSSMYAKKMYEDSKLAAIASNLSSVLYQISAIDIPFFTILSMSLTVHARDFIYLIVSPKGNFYKDIYCKYVLNDMNLPLNVTNIRLELQRRYGIPQNQFDITMGNSIPPDTDENKETGEQSNG